MTGEALELERIIRPGDTVAWPQGTGEPRSLTEALVEQRARLGGVTVLMGISFTDTVRPEHADYLTFRALGGYGRNAALARARVLEVIPCRLSALPGLLRSGVIPVNVLFVQVTPARGRWHSLGPVADYVGFALERARVVVAEVNDQVPWTFGDTLIESTRIDYAVPTSRPLVEVQPAELSQVDLQIGRLVAEMIPDGAVLQFGIGSPPEAVAASLHQARDLGLHSGLMNDRLLELVERGVINNSRKAIDKGVSVAGVLFGTRKLFDFAHNNRRLSLRNALYTHRSEILRIHDRLVAVNSAIEVDLTGQVNAETLAGQYVGAVGGHSDFMQAASSEGRLAIIALPSTAQGQTISRIVPRLRDGVTTTPRSDIDVVVTEHGVAELRGRSLQERARALVRIAHPDFGEELERATATLC